jgi:hypothetical protein
MQDRKVNTVGTRRHVTTTINGRAKARGAPAGDAGRGNAAGGAPGKKPAARTSRAQTATAVIGPLGHLLRSPSAARVLSLFAAEPHRRFTLGDLRVAARAAKGTVLSCLRALERAELVRREGRGAATAYRYAVDRELGQQMLRAVTVSRGAAPAAETFADSMRQWAAAGEALAGAQPVPGPRAEVPASAAERVARLKRLPRTSVGRAAPRATGAYAL